MREVICTGPTPAPGQQFCVMCALRYKQEVLDLPGVQDQIQALMRGDEKLGPALFSLTEAAEGSIVILPMIAVALGIVPQLGGQILPSCWGHLQSVKFTALQPGAGLPDASQVPMLGGRR